jgi:IclR family KDG regulon transcriptional repressor
MNAIEKALDILMVFVPYNQEMGTTEISRKLGLHKATVSRILQTLTQKGLVQQNPQNRKYTLGGSALKIGHAVSHTLRTSLVPMAKSFIDGLRESLMETVTLEAFYGGHSMMAYVANGPQQVRVAAP